MREPEVTSLACCFCFLIKQVHTCTPIHENTESCKSSFSPHKASVKVAQCSSTVLVLVLLQASFSAGVGKKLCLQSGFDKNLQSCLAGPSRILSKHESILKRCKMTMGLKNTSSSKQVLKMLKLIKQSTVEVILLILHQILVTNIQGNV